MYFTIFGGTVHPPVVLNVKGEPPVSKEDMDRHAEQHQALGLPHVSEYKGKQGRLAIVGGGPSIREHIEKLKEWPGEIWSIGGTHEWLRVRGIESTFIAADPHEIVAQWAVEVKRAILLDGCHPKAFAKLRELGADIYVFTLDGPKGIKHGSSTATCSVHVAIQAGYRHLTFFGCEGSYQPELTHAYMREPREEEMIIGCNGECFYTAPDFMAQSVELAPLIRESVKEDERGLYEESGGLLRALVASPEHGILWMSEGMCKIIRPTEKAEAA